MSHHSCPTIYTYSNTCINNNIVQYSTYICMCIAGNTHEHKNKTLKVQKKLLSVLRPNSNQKNVYNILNKQGEQLHITCLLWLSGIRCFRNCASEAGGGSRWEGVWEKFGKINFIFMCVKFVYYIVRWTKTSSKIKTIICVSVLKPFI